MEQECQSISIEEKDEVKKRSQLYVERGKPLSTYHCTMNKAAAQLCLKNPSLLWNRGSLLEEARKVVNESGYVYRKGKSRSKHLNPSLETSTTAPKKRKLLTEARVKHLEAVQEDLKDVTDRLAYKVKRRQAAETVRNYKLCDELTDDISNLKSKKRELEAEVAILKKKSKRSEGYKKRKSCGSTSDTTMFASDGGTSTSTGYVADTEEPVITLPGSSDDEEDTDSNLPFLAQGPPVSPRQEGN